MTHEELAVKAQHGDRAAHQQLWEQTQRLCYYIARRFFPMCPRAGIEREDLEQSLYLGFCAAVSTFDPDSGVKFTSYLTFPIGNACKAELGIRSSQPMQPRPVSLQTPVGDGDFELHELLADENSMRPQEELEDQMYRISLRAMLESMLDELPEQEAAVLRVRYFDGRTRRETAAALRCTISAVETLERRGLCTLRKPRYRRQLEEYHYRRVVSQPPC